MKASYFKFFFVESMIGRNQGRNKITQTVKRIVAVLHTNGKRKPTFS